jgi:hypothetical protein
MVLCCFTPASQAGGPATVNYTYDDLGRLRTGEMTGNLRIDYQYDAAGNRTSMSSGQTPTLTIGNATSVAEGSTLTFPVTRSGVAALNVTVNCVSQNGTAQTGGAAPLDDYTAINQQLTFLTTDPNPTTKNCTVTTKTDSYYEGTQGLSVLLQNATGGAVVTGTNPATGSILDATAAPVFSVAGGSANEGSVVGYTITKTGLTELSHNVSYSTANGSATTADSDYTAIGTTAVTFTAGQTSAPVSVTTTSDGKYEAAETVALNLSSPTNGATLGTSSANGTINNDDAAPTIRVFGGVAVNEGSLVTLTIQNNGNTNTAFTHSISWATANDTAEAGLDYTAASGTVTFSSGEINKTVQVQSLIDNANDGHGALETFFVNISTNASSNGAVITTSQAQGSIADLNTNIPTTPSMVSPAYRQDNDGNFGVDWSDSLGPLSYYILQEASDDLFNSPASYNTGVTSFKSFNYQFNPGDYFYRVKACTSSNVCTPWSSTIQVLNCSGGCP